MTTIHYCPLWDVECPYFATKIDECGEADGVCTLANPAEDCDDYAYYMDNEE